MISQPFSAECSICERGIPSKKYLERHHLVPRVKKGKETVPVCVDCGNQVHRLFTATELRDTYNTLEALKADERVWKWIKWIRKQKFGVCHKTKKRKR